MIEIKHLFRKFKKSDEITWETLQQIFPEWANADLSGANLYGADLSGANLSEMFTTKKVEA